MADPNTNPNQYQSTVPIPTKLKYPTEPAAGTQYERIDTPDGGFIYGYTDQYGDWQTLYTYHPPSSGGGGSAYHPPEWKPGEYDLDVAKYNLDQQKADADWQLQLAKLQQQALSDAYTQAIADKDREQAKRIADQQAANDAIVNQLTAQQNAISLYGQQMSAQASLAGTSANVATTAADWAANPRSAFGYLNLVNSGLAGGSALPTNYAATNQGANAQYQGALQKQFQDIFGNVGNQLNQAWQNTQNAPPATQYQPWYEGTDAYQSASPTAKAIFQTLPIETQRAIASQTPDQAAAFQKYSQGVAQQQQQKQQTLDTWAGMTPDQQRYVQGLTPPASMAGGGQMTINEPAKIVGSKTGNVYATLAEYQPEKIKISPLPKPKPPQQFAEGGTVSDVPDSSSQGQLATSLAKSLRGIGVDYSYQGGGMYAPPVNKLVGSPWGRLQKMPTLMQLLMGAYSASGQDPNDVLAEQARYQPIAPQWTGARFNFR